MLKSYLYHEFVTLTILGGEPLFNNLVIDFLNFLVENSLSHRTRLEFHTNATKFDDKIQNILLPGKWKYICMFLSLDSIGKKAEWLRYGCSWEKIKKNIPLIKGCANYLEVQCTLSVLNISDLEELEQFCIENGLPLKVFPLSTPSFMSIVSWDSDKNLFLNNSDVNHKKFKIYYEMLGSHPVDGMHNKLKNYIMSFEKIRRPLREFNEKLNDILFL
jgi:sulfatase maturation enzyme AslB (radical SAM superfamily)